MGYAPVLENINYTETAQVLEDAKIMYIPRENITKPIRTQSMKKEGNEERQRKHQFHQQQVRLKDKIPAQQCFLADSSN